MASDSPDNDDHWGYLESPMTKQLEAVLRQYPNNGQILKELVQNAEDAEATEAKFLLDKYEFGNTLITKALSEFQGPALYAYNNAKFRDEDWTGIRKLGESVKEESLLKIGKFGLGFKSVYHMTDLPSLMSGPRILFFDPHENSFPNRRALFAWNFEKRQQDKVKFRDQLAPFQFKIFNSIDILSRNHYDHTLFRFPFRKEIHSLSSDIMNSNPYPKGHSEIKDSTYSIENAVELLKSCQADKHMNLLFMKHLEKIQLFVRENQYEAQPVEYFRVQIADSCIEQIREERKRLYKSIDPKRLEQLPKSAVFPVDIEATTFDTNGTEQCKEITTWLITQYIEGQGDISQRAQELKLVPWVELAAPCWNCSILDDLLRAGHTFCFLPLPLPGDRQSMSGLPVHINAFFALDSNRQHLKCPTGNVEEDRNDKEISWNVDLLKHIFPKAFGLMVDFIIHKISEKDRFSAGDPWGFSQLQMLYNIIPDSDKIKFPFNELKQMMFPMLLQKPIFFTPTTDSMQTYANVVVDTLAQEDGKPYQNNCLVQVLLKAQKPVTRVPYHIIGILQHQNVAFETITADLVAQSLQEIQNTDLPNVEEAIQILSFLVSKGCDLQGLQLLPLSNGTMAPFTHPQEKAVYIFHGNESDTILQPFKEDRFVSTSLSQNNQKLFQDIARNGKTQLKYLTTDDAICLLKEVLPQNSGYQPMEWKQDEQTTNEWLQKVWKFLNKHFQTQQDCEILDKHCLYVLPWKTKSGQMFLLPLTKTLPIARPERDNCPIADLVTKLQGIVFYDTSYNTYIQNNDTALNYWLPNLDAVCLLEILLKLYSEEKSTFFKRFSNFSSKVDIRNIKDFLAKGIAANIEFDRPELFRFMKLLPIFEQTKVYGESECSKFVSLEELPLAIPDGDILPTAFNLPKEFLHLTRVSDKKLADLHGIKPMDPSVFYTVHLFPALTVYSQEAMVHILRHHRNQQVYECIKQLQFLPNNEKLCRPSELFDPSDDLLEAIFQGEDVFPKLSPMGNEREYVSWLKEVGLKTSKHVTIQDLLKAAGRLEFDKEFEGKSRSNAMLRFVEQNMERLRADENFHVLESTAWVLGESQKPPKDYPSQLQWYGQYGNFCRPTDVNSTENSVLVGSTNSLIDTKEFVHCDKEFGWSTPPKLEHVVGHLKNIVQSYHPEKREDHIYSHITFKIYQYLSAQDPKALVTCGLQQWIWHGSGFVDIEHVIPEPFKFPVEPYCFPLPHDMKIFGEFFKNLGIKGLDTKRIIGILCDIRNSFDDTKLDQDLNICRNILEELTLEHHTFDPQEVYVPVYQGNSSSNIRWVPIPESTYRGTEDLSDFDDCEETLNILHTKIPTEVAEKLGVPSLISRFFDGEEGMEDAGQSQSLTDKIHDLISRDYTDGFSIIKELLQNADDAGATEMKILYDERMNENAMKGLFDQGMQKCQGAAVWAYNNAKFTPKDFEHILALGGATKEKEPTKIGRFGYGFNSVYNITDVPTIVSDDTLLILDPDTSHLGRIIRNKAKPGTKLKVKEKRTFVNRFKNQFHPFTGIFGCDILKKDVYDATLIRLPLRISKSELSDEVYTKARVEKLLEKLEEHCSTLLLFTQNVKKIGVYCLHKDATNPAEEMKERFTLEKDIVQELPSHTINFSSEQSFLNAARQQKEKGEFQEIVSSVMVRIQQSAPLKMQDWLICSSIGSGGAYELSISDDTLLPVGGVAVPLSKEHKHYLPSLDSGLVPEIFCFLPLNLGGQTGFPVHINGYFALESNRRNLYDKRKGEANDMKGEWNEILFQDIICHAFLKLLESLTEICHPKEYDQYCLWPDFQTVDGTFVKILTCSFYQNLSHQEGSKVFSNGSQWMSMSDIVLLSDSLQESMPVCKIIQQMHEEYRRQTGHKNSIVLMPTTIRQNFKEYKCKQALDQRIWPNKELFSGFILPWIEEWDSEDRNAIVKWALRNDHTLDTIIKSKKCIPVAPDGNVLLAPKRLINHNGKASALYSEADQRFPHHSFNDYREALLRVGMVQDNLDWDDIIERAQSISTPAQAEKFRHYLKWKLVEDVDDGNRYTIDGRQFQNIPFLCAVPKQTDYNLPWFEGSQLVSPSDAYLKSEISQCLISSVCPLVDMDSDLAQFLGLKNKEISTPHTIEHLFKLADMDIELMTSCRDQLRETCFKIYQYLNTKIYQYLNTNIQSIDWSKIGNKAVVFLPESLKFVKPEVCAYNTLQEDMGGYLFKLPVMFHSSDNFFDKVGVKKSFTRNDYLGVLKQIHTIQDGRPLSNDKAYFIVSLLEKMSNAFPNLEGTFAPDENRILRETSALCYKDYDGLQLGSNNYYCHSKISSNLASKLNIRSIREKVIGQHSIPSLMSFGQKEELTTRIKGILENCHINDVLKELLQNADDAGASEIHFILDERHHGEEQVFGKTWKDLQGPALLVYNDKPFSKEDLAGIQRLGVGSKRDDPTRTGQYGVGFNCVYHLTDVPSLVTTVEGMGEILCIFDPHCSYAPGATYASPGACLQTKELERDFADTFKPYLGDEKLDYKGGTLFRFPLRTSKMAEKSSFRENELKLEDLDSLLNALRKEMSKSLLFLKHVKKIKMWVIEANARQKSLIASVEGTLSETDDAQYTEFKESIRENSQAVKKKLLNLQTLPPSSLTYEMKIQSENFNEKSTEIWLVSQSIGFETFIGDANLARFTMAKIRGELVQFPRGGVARLITIPPHQQWSAIFCFLPLPISTKFPVHVNGHFVLGGANRRGLWRNKEAPDFRDSWNTLLFKHVIVQAYVNLLMHMKEKVETGDISLEEYYETFPTESEEGYTDDCMKALYWYIYKTNKPLLPVKRTNGNIEWYTPCTEDGHIDVVYFNVLQQGDPLTRILLDLGFNLLDMPMKIRSSFKKAEVRLPKVKQEDVLNYMKTDKCKEYLPLPSPITKTCFKNIQNLTLLLQWCQGLLVENNLTMLVDLPILATEDGNLQVFSKENEIFYSYYHDLVPKSKAKFVHHDLLKVFGGLKQSFKKFDVKSFAELLSFEDGRKNLKYQTEVYKPWKPRYENQLLNWLRRVWRFAKSDVVYEFNNKQYLKPLEEWHLLPVIKSHADMGENSETYLVPIKRATTVVHPTESSPEVFKKFKFPEPDYSILEKISSFSFGSIHKSNFGRSSGPGFSPMRKASSGLTSSSYGTTSTSFGTSPFGTTSANLNSNTFGTASSGIGSSLFGTTSLGVRSSPFGTPSPGLNSSPFGTTSPVLNTSPFGTTMLGVGCSQVGKTSVSPLISTNRKLVLQDNDECVRIIKGLVATPDNPRTMLDALDWAVEQNQLPESLELREAESLANYFAEKLYIIKGIGCSAKQTLKNLPMFVTYDGKITSLKDVAIHILPHTVPKQGMDKWYKTVMFLRDPSPQNVKDLYVFLCIREISIGDFYCDVVLKYYQELSEEEWESHLEYLRDKTEYLLHQDEEKIIDKMKTMKFIRHTNGDMFTVNQYFDPEVEVFALMERDMLIPEKYRGPNWSKFFSKLGMKDSLTFDMFISYAKVIEQEGNIAADTVVLTKSRALQNYLGTLQKEWHDPTEWNTFLGRIKSVCFVSRKEIGKSLLQIAPLYDGNSKLTCYQGAVEGNLELVWTVASVIDSSHCTELSHFTKQQLGIVMEPQEDKVIDHSENVCEGIKQKSDKALDVLKQLHKYFQRNQGKLTSDTIQRLKEIPIVGIEHGEKLILVKPKQLFLRSDDVEGLLHPHVFPIPLKLGKFGDLFEFLGASKAISVHHYIFVLSALAKITEGQVLNPVTLQKPMKIITKLFKELAENGPKSDGVEKVYLLSAKNSLISIDRLVYADKPSLANRSELDEAEEFLFSPEETKLEASVYLKAIDHLTKWYSGKLKLLSSLLCEVLTPGCKVESYTECQGGLQLKRHLTSPAFLDGVIRIIYDHFIRIKNCPLSEEDVTKMRTILLNIEVLSVDLLKTHLTRNGSTIPNSETPKKIFAQTVGQVGHHELKIYIDKECSYRDLVDEIVSIVERIAMEIFKDKCLSEKYLLRILELEDPLAIKEYLDNSNLIPYGMKHYTANMVPVLGSLVPIADHHMLDPEFKDFEVGEFVAYEVIDTYEEMNFDNSEERTFQYAQILRKEGSQYQINLGEDLGTKGVKDIFLFGFYDISNLLQGLSSRVSDFANAKSMIDRFLSKARYLNQRERFQIYKRLFLIWHPQCHGNTEAYAYLKKAIEDQEQKLNTSVSMSSSGPSKSSFWSSNYNSASNCTKYFSHFEQIVTTSKTQRTAYIEEFNRMGLDINDIWEYSFIPPSLSTSNPQPREAQRWLKQAEADFQAAPGDLGGEAYEWTCFKCHQAAEKALKSVRYLNGSWPSDRRWTHRLREIASGCGSELSSLAGQLETVCEDSTKMRYPDKIQTPKIPHDYYDLEKANASLEITRKILEEVKEHFIAKK